MPLQIELRKERSIMIFQLSGSILKDDGASELKHSLQECRETGQSSLILDLKGVVEIDEGGADILRRGQAEARQAGGDLRIASAKYPILAALALYDTGALFSYYGSSEDAETAFQEADGKSSNGVKHFDILKFVQEQERENQESGQSKDSSDAESDQSGRLY